MIDIEAREELDRLRPEQGPHSMLLEWTGRLAPSGAATASRRARLEDLQRQLRERKRPLLDRLAGIRGVEVQDLAALPQAIVRASPDGWAQIAGKGGVLDREPGVRLVPTQRFETLDSEA